MRCLDHREMTEDGRAVVEIHPAAYQFPATENGTVVNGNFLMSITGRTMRSFHNRTC